MVCGRRFAWRKKWRNNWLEVRYCSEQCRKSSRVELKLGSTA
ncbi:MAG: DUF2256 domain-containing protein [Candidatus Binatia bacterium]